MENYPSTHLVTAASLAAVLSIVLVVVPASEAPATTRIPVSVDLSAPPSELEDVVQPEIVWDWHNVTVRRGDSLALIFDRMKLSPRDLHLIMESGNDARTLARIAPGQVIGFVVNENGELERLRYQISAMEELNVYRQDDTFAANLDIRDPEIITSYTFGEITSDAPSLYQAGKKAGLTDTMVMKLANIFQWDISFALDLRAGDRFAVIYEELYINGEKADEGDIVAAWFRTEDREHVALLYDNGGQRAYFTPDGRSLRKAFIRDPVHFSHVSSSFNLQRLHPIHKKVMPHRGIDYAAKKGTPVFAAGDGKVALASQNSASGKFIVVQHGQQYTTKYLHLSGFAKGIRDGSKVSQGQVIGYVGATGWATAPHLHYEFLVNGVHRNPRTVSLPKADPIPAGELAIFQQRVMPMLTRLSSIAGNTSMAAAERAPSNEG